MRVRTNLHLDSDALSFANYYANAKGISLGVAVSELIRRSEHAPEPDRENSPKLERDSYGVLVVTGGPPITSEGVRKFFADEVE